MAVVKAYVGVRSKPVNINANRKDRKRFLLQITVDNIYRVLSREHYRYNFSIYCIGFAQVRAVRTCSIDRIMAADLNCGFSILGYMDFGE